MRRVSGMASEKELRAAMRRFLNDEKAATKAEQRPAAAKAVKEQRLWQAVAAKAAEQERFDEAAAAKAGLS